MNGQALELSITLLLMKTLRNEAAPRIAGRLGVTQTLDLTGELTTDAAMKAWLPQARRAIAARYEATTRDARPTLRCGVRAGSLIRMTVASALVFFIVLLGLANVILQLRADNAQLRADNLSLTHNLADDQSTITELTSQLEDLRSRWIGKPALWSAPGLPADESIIYFSVQGETQNEIEDSLAAAKLCSKYGCAPDPGAPPGGETWALEGNSAPATVCYSPVTFRVAWHYTMILPSWAPAPDGSVRIPLVEAWNGLAQVLFTHESRHVAIARADLSEVEAQAHNYSTCAAAIAYLENPHTYDKLNADQNAFHAQLRADCRPELGCVPPGWMGW